MTWKLLLLCLSLFFSRSALAVDPFQEWKTLTSEHFQVHFATAHKQQAERALRIAENAHRSLSVALNWHPKDRTHLVLSDETDFANGFATVFNIRRSVLFMAPPTGIGGLEDFDDWLNLLITHEYVHALHLDKAHGTPAGLRKLFGRQLLGFPNVFEPTWLIEGLATWYETDRNRNIGRGQSSFFNSMMRAEVERGIKPVDQVNLPIASWPSGATRYLYGVYFFTYLEETYGSDIIQAFIEQYSINLIPFSINATFERVFDKDVTQMWTAYSAWLEAKFRPQIAQRAQAGIVEGQTYSQDFYRTRHVRAHGDAVYYIRDSGDAEEAIVRQQGADSVVIAETTNASFDVRANGDVIISQLEVCDEYAIYYDIYLYQAATKELQRLTECGRYQRAIWSPAGDEIYVVKHFAGVFELQVLDDKAQLKRRLYPFDEGDIPGWFDVSADNDALVMSIWRPDYGWNLYSLSVSDGALTALTQDNFIQAYPEYSSDNSHIYYSADYAGTYDVYRIDDQGKHEQISRSRNGALQMSAQGETLYYTAYTADGTGIMRLPQVQAIDELELTTGSIIEPYQFADVTSEISDYSAWPSLAPAWWFPSLVVTQDSTEVGLNTAGNDALGLHNYFAAVSLDIDNSLAQGSFVYGFSNLFSVVLARDTSLFKTTAGDKDRIRSEDQLQFVYAFPDNGAQTSSNILMAVGLEHNKDAKLFNAAVPAASFDDNLFGLAWLYNSTRLYPLSISLNDGRQITLVAEDGGLLDSDFDGQVYTARWQEFISLSGEHVLAIRALLGIGEGISTAFRLGGEDTDISYDLFFQESGAGLFGRREYALRGYEEGLPQLRGQNAQLYSAEWRFPGQRIERGIMAPPLGIMQWSGTLFAETGAAYNDDVDTFYSSIGAEVTADLNLFYLVPVRARFGLAHGLDDNLGDTRAYLSLGSSF